MKVSATTMKNPIGVKSTEETGKGSVTGSSTTASTPALFLLMLLQQCNTPTQVKLSAVNSQAKSGEALEPTMSFFGEIAALQSETPNAKTDSTSEKTNAPQKNVAAAALTVQGESHNMPLASTATASEDIASLMRTMQNTNTTLDGGSPKLFTTQTNAIAISKESDKIISPVMSTTAQAIPTNGELVNLTANTVLHSKKIKTSSDSVSQNVKEIAAEISTSETTTIAPSSIDIVAAANSVLISFMKPVKEQHVSDAQKSTEKKSSETSVSTENKSAVLQETQTTVTNAQAASQGSLNSQGKSTSQKSDEKTDSHDASVTATESPSTSSTWNEILKTQTEGQPTTTSVLHSSVSSNGISTTHTDQTMSGVHAASTSQDSAAGLTKMPDALLDQVVSSVVMQVHENSSQMKILLQPESLGEMFVKVKVDDGKVNTQIEVSNPTTKTMLEANIGQLRENLSARGVDMQHIEIVASNQTGLGTSDGRSETQGQKLKRSFYNDTEDTSEENLHDLGYNTMEFVI